MRIRWSPSALARLDAISDYLSERNPAAAEKMLVEIFRRTSLLADHPHLGRSGRVPGTRELIVVGTPYLVIYRVERDQVEIIAVFHGAQRSPDVPEGLL